MVRTSWMLRSNVDEGAMLEVYDLDYGLRALGNDMDVLNLLKYAPKKECKVIEVYTEFFRSRVETYLSSPGISKVVIEEMPTLEGSPKLSGSKKQVGQSSHCKKRLMLDWVDPKESSMVNELGTVVCGVNEQQHTATDDFDDFINEDEFDTLFNGIDATFNEQQQPPRDDRDEGSDDDLQDPPRDDRDEGSDDDLQDDNGKDNVEVEMGDFDDNVGCMQHDVLYNEMEDYYSNIDEKGMEERVFGSKEGIKKMIDTLAIETRRQIVLVKNDAFRIRTVCWGTIPELGGQARDVRACTATFLSQQIEETLPANPEILIKSLQVTLEQKYENNISHMKSFRAKKIAMEKLMGDYTEQYNVLRDYIIELLITPKLYMFWSFWFSLFYPILTRFSYVLLTKATKSEFCRIWRPLNGKVRKETKKHGKCIKWTQRALREHEDSSLAPLSGFILECSCFCLFHVEDEKFGIAKLMKTLYRRFQIEQKRKDKASLVFRAAKLQRTNPGTIVKLDVETDGQLSNETRQFKRIYVCLGALKKGFAEGKREILGLDGAFMKGPFPGQVLTAVGMDSNNGTYPLAYAIVEAETKQSWSWFLECLSDDLNLVANSNFTFIFDRQKVFPCAEHRHCVRHIQQNMKQKWKGKVYSDYLWKCAAACTVEEFTDYMEEFKAFDADAHKCQLVDGRDKPIITALEYIGQYLMKRIVSVQKLIENSDGPLTPNVVDKLKEIKAEATKYQVLWNGADECQVTAIWNMTVNGLDVGIVENWVDPVYWLQTWKAMYSFKISPINGRKLWPKSGCPTIITAPKHHT
ncbi:hypothetical protein OSB04_002332 [Centaurea solstitialis]|uniref:MULE transposase domain-containing protein n=1 Tax=Centaurea solstitialis TaxID=347529 RepID=A0AA38U3A8_9ASTR|nr:hypothetical protein OSB04_002332 [Centaurea solstitialis]